MRLKLVQGGDLDFSPRSKNRTELLQVIPLGVVRKVARALKLVYPVGHGLPLEMVFSITAARRIEQDRTKRVDRVSSCREFLAVGQTISVKIILGQDISDSGDGILKVGMDHALLPFIGEPV